MRRGVPPGLLKACQPCKDLIEDKIRIHMSGVYPEVSAPDRVLQPGALALKQPLWPMFILPPVPDGLQVNF